MRLTLTLFVSILFGFAPTESKAFEMLCPQDYYLNCNAEIWDLSAFGQAHYKVNYVTYSAGLAHVNYHLNSCNTGYITRTWTVEDQYWGIHSCTQYIYVAGGNFKYSDIHWPLDHLEISGCAVDASPDALPAGYKRPSWNYVSCSQIASSYRDQVFHFGPDCKKILRQWTVIDWCTYTAGGSKGIYHFTQTIKVGRNEPPLLSCAKEVIVKSIKCDSTFVKMPAVSLEGRGCDGDYTVIHNSPFDTLVTGSASGIYPVGITEVRYSALYGCGSEVACVTKVKVTQPGPVPYCLADINVVLMAQDTDLNGTVDNGMVEVWAKDVNIGSYHPCNDRMLLFSFSSDVNDNVKVFTCDEVGYNTVQMWVTDHLGNQSYCLVNINVQNNAANIPNCAPDIGARNVVYGNIEDEKHEAVTEVIITAKDRQPLYDYVTDIVETVEYITIDSFYNSQGTLLYIYDTETSLDTMVVDSFARTNVHHLYADETGRFESNEIPIGRNYEFTAFKTDNMAGINNADLTLLANYVFGGNAFQNPYTYIAADINEDKNIDLEDFYILKDLINEEEDEWPKERQWLFYNMANMESMSDTPLEDDMSEMVEVPELYGSGNKVQFMGIMKGNLTKYESQSSIHHDQEIDYRSKNTTTEAKIFPNPFSSNVQIRNTQDLYMSAELYSLTGKKVRQITIEANGENDIDTKDLPNGTYMYRLLVGGEEVESGKILKAK